MSSKRESVLVCEHCGTVGQPTTRKPGHTAVSVVFLIFGLIALVAFMPLGILFLLGWVGYGILALGCNQAGLRLLWSPRGASFPRVTTGQAGHC